MMPLVSIITPSFNQGEFVEDTIKSVLNQDYKNIEYIFVDGGSIDNTMSVVNKYRNKIDFIIHEKDNGQADAINKGFKLANGELVGWLNSDDILYSDCVSKIVELYLSNPDSVIFYHSFNDRINRDGVLIETYQHVINNKLYLLKSKYDVIQQGSFYKREVVARVGYLDVKNHYCMDLDLWLSLLDYGAISYTTDCSHSGIRRYADTKTATGRELFLKNIYAVLIKHGAKFYYPTIYRQIYFYMLKAYLKKFLRL